MFGTGFLEFSFGPVIFFPITAIFSVAMLTLAMSFAIRGMLLQPKNKSAFVVMFTLAASFAAIFFYAVMRYKWLGGETAYDGLYHSIGYIGSLVIGIVTFSIANARGLGSAKITLLSLGVPLGFLVVIGLIAPFIRGVVPPEFIGFLYASIQLIFPFVVYITTKSKASIATSGATQPVQTVPAPVEQTPAQPVAQPPVPQQPVQPPVEISQPDPSNNAPQNPLNGQ